MAAGRQLGSNRSIPAIPWPALAPAIRSVFPGGAYRWLKTHTLSASSIDLAELL
jgi:hypothetical protein